jgi:shikimate dehydrogenase
MNVTIPYKTTIIPYIDELNEEAKSIGAVNCIHIENKKWIGYNTDAAAFYEALPTHIKYKNALILGNGGAAKAVAFALNKNKIAFDVVSRQYIKNLETSSLKDMQNNVLFDDLGKCKMDTYDLIINCTPVGMSQDDKPFAINWKRVNVNAIAYDLIYNPIETQFLQSAQLNNISTINGLKMLHLQADKSFDIWMKQSQKNN